MALATAEPNADRSEERLELGAHGVESHPNAARPADFEGRSQEGSQEGSQVEPYEGSHEGPPHWGAPQFRLDTPYGRWRAWSSMFFVDHGFFRYVYLNLHPIDENAYRSAQPAPRHFRRIAALGVRTVVNLRGGRNFGSYPLEREACARRGIAYEEITLRSREAPRMETLREAEALLDRIAYPALFHCKSGADRAGLMSALYIILRAGRSAAEAKRMLSLRYGHVRQSKTGVLDAFLDAFDAAQREEAAAGRDLALMDWAEQAYDPRAMNKAFRTKAWADWLVDGVLRRE